MSPPVWRKSSLRGSPELTRQLLGSVLEHLESLDDSDPEVRYLLGAANVRLGSVLGSGDIRLMQWFERLRMHMAGPRADRIAERNQQRRGPCSFRQDRALRRQRLRRRPQRRRRTKRRGFWRGARRP